MDVLAESVIEILKRGGWVLVPIFAVGQIGWIIVFERYFKIKSLSWSQKSFWKNAPAQKDKFGEYLAQKKDQVGGIFGDLARGIYVSSQRGEKAMTLTARSVLEEHTYSLQKNFTTMGVMANSAPLLGLLGTVAGMVTTFKIITIFGIGNPSMMATGISQALFTTQAGLVVSFPLVLLHNTLHSKADNLESECIGGATRLINQLR